MARGSSTALSRDIQTLFDSGTAAGLTDRQLLDRFAGRRDPSAEAAFEALVRAPRADGPARLPQPAPRPQRRPRRLPGHVPGPGAAVRGAPGVRFARRLALRRRLPAVGKGAGRGGPAPGRRGACGPAGRRGRRAGRCRGHRPRRIRPDRAGGSPPAAREIPRRGGALLLGRTDAGAGRGAARLPAGHRPQPAGPRPRPAAAAADPARARADGPRDRRDPAGCRCSCPSWCSPRFKSRPVRWRIRSSRPRWLPCSDGCSGGRR